MKYRITTVFDRDNGKTLGYDISYKPFPFIPYWRACNRLLLYKNVEDAEHDIIWLMSLDGKIKYNQRYV